MKNAIEEFEELLNWLEERSLLSSELVNEITKAHSEKDKWEELRNSFVSASNGTFMVEPMNSANLCPTLEIALDVVSYYRSQFNNNISMQFRRELFQRINSVGRSLVASHIGGNRENLAFVRNTSEANNQLSRGFNKWAGNEVLLWDENHPTNRHVWHSRCPKDGKVSEFSLKGLNFDDSDDEVEKNIIKRITDAITDKTVILSFSEVSNVSGIRLPTAAIIKSIRNHIKDRYKRDENSIHIHVDGAVSWGALKIDVKETDCDSFSSSAHKWLMGPFETGILYMKSEKAANFDISIHGYNGNIDFTPEIPRNTSRFELLGQRDEANLLGMMAAVREHLNIGREEIEKKIKSLQKQLRKQLDDMAIETNVLIKYATPKSELFSNGVTVMQFQKRDGEPFNHPRLNAFLYADKEGERFAVSDTGIGAEKTNELRICPHIINSEESIHNVVKKIKKYLTSALSEGESSQLLVDTSSSMNWPNNPYANTIGE